MGIGAWFGFSSDENTTDLPSIFPLDMNRDEFVETDIINIYTKILTDAVERIQGLTDEQIPLLWDNCLKSESNDGLISLLAKAMADMEDLFVVYDKALKLIRKATSEEQDRIRADYKSRGESATGLFISFKNYKRSDMVKLYSALEYCTVASLNKSLNISAAIQFKMNDLRSSTGLADSTTVITQAKAIARALTEGKDVLTDAKDIIESAIPDLAPVEAAIKFLNQKRSFYLGLPESYINGEQTGGMGTTGENDTKATERGLKNYWFSILKPVLEKLFGSSLTYKSQDFRQIAQGLECLKTFELTGEDLLTLKSKQNIITGIFDVEESDTKELPKEREPEPAPAPAPVKPGQTNAK